MKQKLFQSFVRLTGNEKISHFLQGFTSSPLSKPLIRPFQKIYSITDAEMVRPVASYETLNEFFTRSIDMNLRPIDQHSNAIVSPVDADLTAAGPLHEGTRFTIKGKTYSIDEVFGSKKIASSYENGYYYIFYLSPQHYHHFHHPIDGTIRNRYALGSTSYPVNQLGLTYGDEPFHTNYRLITELDTNYGNIAIVKVGALNVNSVQLYCANEHVEKGKDFGHFSFGSTVVLFLSHQPSFESTVDVGSAVHVGEKVGQWL
ncbi:archaetidylserine decarboxylase [Savagea faecisuis]|uniref:phosphatidylserine decarboxylase n=1 Tax=Savagea faecisuis TaxID=1274803 RepID=A0ABW3GYM6_9BACL